MPNLFSYRAEKNAKAWFFLLPALIFIFVFSVLPLIRTFELSFLSNSILNAEFVQWENYAFVLKDPHFHKALQNTSLFALIVVPLGMVISLIIAIILNQKIKGAKILETIFFLPYLTSIIAIGIVFRYLFHGNYGFINYFLSLFNLGPFDFLNNPKLNIISLMIFGIWSSLAFNIIILLSGLRSIDKNFYTLAKMYGASPFEEFTKITLPSLIPILTFLSITNFISAFKVYAQVFSLFNGKAGIGNAAVTSVFYIYNKFYVEARYGQGMAAAVILFLLILLFTLLQRFILKKISN